MIPEELSIKRKKEKSMYVCTWTHKGRSSGTPESFLKVIAP
jgi:hypothetical protein